MSNRYEELLVLIDQLPSEVAVIQTRMRHMVNMGNIGTLFVYVQGALDGSNVLSDTQDWQTTLRQIRDISHGK